MVTGRQLGDEGQVGDLRGCPAELEDDDEGEVVDEGCPLRRVLIAAQAGVEDEGEGQEDAGGAWEESGAVSGCKPSFPPGPAGSDVDGQTDRASPLLGQILPTGLGREVGPFPQPAATCAAPDSPHPSCTR